MDFDNHFEAIDGWLGCPSCQRPVDARAFMADAKRRLLIEVRLELERRRLLTPQVFKVIDGWEGVQAEIAEAAIEDRPPTVEPQISNRAASDDEG